MELLSRDAAAREAAGLAAEQSPGRRAGRSSYVGDQTQGRTNRERVYNAAQQKSTEFALKAYCTTRSWDRASALCALATTMFKGVPQ